jgi:NitT/TauT family transport system ATP-binding protein
VTSVLIGGWPVVDKGEGPENEGRRRGDLHESVPAIRFHSIGKTFPDGTVALRNISLFRPDGGVRQHRGTVGLRQVHLLRIASNLTPATTGEVERSAPQDVGYAFQDPTLLPWRTVEGNVKLSCELNGIPKGEGARLAQEAIELAGLRDFEKHHPWALSGGMRMRVSLARSLTMNPRLFLFDEPFAALDEITRQRLNEELLRLFVHKQFAAIFVTHSVSEAVYLSNRVLVMSPRPGRIFAELGVPFDFPRPRTQRFEAQHAEVAAAAAEALRAGSE